jgi:hypothetical protein
VVYTPSAVFAGTWTVYEAEPLAPGVSEILAGEKVAGQPAGAAEVSEKVLLGQVLLSLFTTETV